MSTSIVYPKPKVINLDAISDKPEQQARIEQHQSDFFDAIQESLVVLVTSSPDKRVKYRTLFNVLENSTQDGQGIDAYFTDIGALNIPPSKTPERSGNYRSHAVEKAAKALEQLREHKELIQNKLIDDISTDRPMIAMVEDSGWEITFSNEQYDEPHLIKKHFLRNVRNLLEERFKPEDRNWLFNHIKPEDPHSTFPGPNLKPIQEALTGSFNEMMEVIYEAAQLTEGMDAEKLRYQSNLSFAFGVLHNDGQQQIFTKNFNSAGKIISPEAFAEAKEQLPLAASIDSNVIHIPDNQKDNAQKTLKELEDVSLVKHSSQQPFSFARRKFAEWLQDGVGAKPAQSVDQELHIAYVSSEEFERATTYQSVDREPYEQGLKTIMHDIFGDDSYDKHQIIAIPTREALRQFPNRKMLNGTDIVILRGSKETVTEEGLVYDPNLMLTDYMVVNTQTDPLSMTIPIIIDNRNGDFDRTLRIFKDAYQSGRFMGELPFHVASDDASLQRIITEQTRAVQLSKLVDTNKEQKPLTSKASPDTSQIPEALFDANTVFVAGGHNNNSWQDKEEAFQLGYMLAEEGVNIVTGGGQVEGSMGNIHTGFIQYHMDTLIKEIGEGNIQKDALINEFISHLKIDETINAEEMIEKHSALINKLADAGHIPKDKFYAYSTKPLIKMESPNGEHTAGVSYTDTINRIPRLDALLAPKTMVFMPGGVGTDEEMVHAIRQQLLLTKELVEESDQHLIAANDNAGEQPYLPKLIVYNRAFTDAKGNQQGQIDGFLAEVGIYREYNGEYVVNDAVCEKYNIKVMQAGQNPELTAIEIATEALTAIEEVAVWSKGVSSEHQMNTKRAVGM